MFNFTKGRCNVAVSGARCSCNTGRCAFDPNGAGDVEALKCHSCSHRMWDHDDSLLDNFDVESGIGNPPPYEEGPRRSDTQQQQQQQFINTLAFPSEPARSHYPTHRNEPIRPEQPLTGYNFPRDGINLQEYDAVHGQMPRPKPPARTCTANLLIGIILGFVIVGTPIIAYRVVTS